MATYMYLLDGRSLEQVFAPRSGATPVAATGLYDDVGTDLNLLFFPLTRARQAPLTYFYMPAPDNRDLADVFDTQAGIPKSFGSISAFRPSTQNGSATATLTIRPDGTVGRNSSPQGDNVEDSWFTVPRAGVGSEFEIYWSSAGGSFPTTAGWAHGTWSAIDANKVFTMFAANNNSSSGTLAFSIRRIGTTEQTNFQMTMSAQGGGNA